VKSLFIESHLRTIVDTPHGHRAPRSLRVLYAFFTKAIKTSKDLKAKTLNKYDVNARRSYAPSFVSCLQLSLGRVGLLLVRCLGDAVSSEQGAWISGNPGPCRPAHNTPKGVAERKGPGRTVISCMVRLDHEYPEWQFGSRLSFRSVLQKCHYQKGHR
jgi:hypothetical protein